MISKSLPQLSGEIFLTDGGAETTFVFRDGIDLPCFAAHTLLKTEAGRTRLREYYRTYAQIAVTHQVGFILESPTWRANPDWGTQLGYSADDLAAVNREALGMLHELREELESPTTPMVISGCLGPRGDGYRPSSLMNAEEAAAYHSPQIRTCRDAGAELVSAFTLNYMEEALGIVEAAETLKIPVVISFTLETDGRLPSGQTLQEAIETIDERAGVPPVYYMINCAHPTHFADMLPAGQPWLDRIRALRANASCRSHAELDACTELDAGNPEELGRQYCALREKLPNLTILGGCCGTDDRHLSAIAESWLASAPRRGLQAPTS